MAQNGNNAAYSSKHLKMTQKRFLLKKNRSKCQKCGLVFKIAQNGKNAAYL